MSVKDRVNSFVSDTRQTANQYPISASEKLPQMKVGSVTFTELSDNVGYVAFECVENGNKLKKTSGQKLLDILFQSPRLTQWEKVEFPNGYSQWRIFTKDDSIYVIVSNNVRDEGFEGVPFFEVSLHKGQRAWSVVQGLPAQSLWQALEQAQPIVQQAEEEQVLTNEEEESYFEDGAEDYYDGAALDSALEDQHVKPLSADDAELIEDVTTAKEEDYADTIVDSIVIPKPFVEETEPVKHTAKVGRLVDAEVKRVKQEYPELEAKQYKDNPVQDCPRIETTRVVQHFKSLQGNILTIIEGCLGDVQQRNAVKTLINKAFRQKMNNLNNGWSQDED